MQRYTMQRESDGDVSVWTVSEHTGSKLDPVYRDTHRKCRQWIARQRRQADARQEATYRQAKARGDLAECARILRHGP